MNGAGGISRILCLATAFIYLRGLPFKKPAPRLRGCDIPEAIERAAPPPILSCTGLGLHCPGGLLRRRWALAPPFHPYRLRGGLFSVALSVRVPCETRPALSGGVLPWGVRTFLSCERTPTPRLAVRFSHACAESSILSL